MGAEQSGHRCYAAGLARGVACPWRDVKDRAGGSPPCLSSTGFVLSSARRGIRTCTARAGCAGNPQFEYVAKDEAALQKMVAANHPKAEELRTWQQAEQEVADFYDRYVSEMHPCRDAHGAELYGFNDLTVENLQLPHRAKPQCVRLLPLLEDVLRSEEPDLNAAEGGVAGSD